MAHPMFAKPDLAIVKALLADASLPTIDLTDEHCAHFICAGSLSRPDGIVGVEILGEAGLLRSLVVRDAARGAGLGSALVLRIEEYAQALGVRDLYLLTTTAQTFFEARGYRVTNRATAPAVIRATREFAGICPASSAFMVKRLA